MSSLTLTVENLTKRYDERDVVYNVSLSVSAGEIAAVKGQTGSGKTTLLKLAAGLIPPTSGNIMISGKTIQYRKSGISPEIGMLLHNQGVYQRLTTREYLSFFRRLYGVEKSRVDEVIREVGLLDRQDDRLKNFSPSLIARVEMARTILHNPSLLLLDEPTAHLDLETMEILRKLIINYASKGTAVLFTTSSSEEATALAHKTGNMYHGRIDAWEKSEDINQETGALDVQHSDSRLRIEKIPAKVNDRIILFNPTELTYIESQEGISLLHAGGEEFQCPLTLTELEEKLKPFGFFRSHRSYIVNLQRVREVIPWTRNSYSLILDDVQKTTIPLSKNSMKELEGFLGV
ncbi:MAG: ATP-binding cassette domain-containing protein [Clostridia bacterium]|nr:ATP-binding cassette domain-containing protein [Clostridia bacterium]